MNGSLDSIDVNDSRQQCGRSGSSTVLAKKDAKFMETKPNQSGIFVTLEGADRTGKSTQAKLLADELTKLTGKQCLQLKFPDRDTALGHYLNDYLTGKVEIDAHALHLLFTANRWERDTELRAALSSGRSVVADRYTHSGIAYTSAKQNPTPDWHWCCQMEQGLVEPDIVICLTPENIADLRGRSGFGGERYETDDFQQRVLQNYLRLSEKFKNAENDESAADQAEWHFVQATGKSVEEVHGCIMAIVKDKLKSMKIPDIADVAS